MKLGHFPEEVSIVEEMVDETAIELHNHLHCSYIVHMLAEVRACVCVGGRGEVVKRDCDREGERMREGAMERNTEG